MAKVIVDYSIHGDGQIEMEYDPSDPSGFTWEQIHEAVLWDIDDKNIHLTYPEE